MERPPVSPSLSPTVAVCCCGSDSCESLRKTQTMLQDLENQMRIAGTLGKVSSRDFASFFFFNFFYDVHVFLCVLHVSRQLVLYTPNNRELVLSARCLSLLCGFLPRSVNLVPLPQTHTRILFSVALSCPFNVQSYLDRKYWVVASHADTTCIIVALSYNESVGC